MTIIRSVEYTENGDAEEDGFKTSALHLFLSHFSPHSVGGGGSALVLRVTPSSMLWSCSCKCSADHNVLVFNPKTPHMLHPFEYLSGPYTLSLSLLFGS